MRMGLVAGLLLMLGSPAWGQTCVALATGESFGTYNPFSPTATTSTATLSVTCQNTVSVLVSYSIALGSGSGGAIGARRMSSGGASLTYQLYRNASYSQVWGDGTGGSVTATDGYVLGVLVPVTRSYTAYGVIPPGLAVGPGVYSDTIVVMVSY